MSVMAQSIRNPHSACADFAFWFGMIDAERDIRQNDSPLDDAAYGERLAQFNEFNDSIISDPEHWQALVSAYKRGYQENHQQHEEE